MFYDLSVTPIKGNDTFKAEASMKIQDAFVVHQMHVIQGWNGNTFVGMPQKPNTQKGKKEDIAHEKQFVQWNPTPNVEVALEFNEERFRQVLFDTIESYGRQ